MGNYRKKHFLTICTISLFLISHNSLSKDAITEAQAQQKEKQKINCEKTKSNLQKLQANIYQTKMKGSITIPDSLKSLVPEGINNGELDLFKLESLSDAINARKAVLEGIGKINDDYKKYLNNGRLFKNNLEKNLNSIDNAMKLISQNSLAIKRADMMKGINTIISPKEWEELRLLDGKKLSPQDHAARVKTLFDSKCENKEINGICQRIRSLKEDESRKDVEQRVNNLINGYILATATSITSTRNAAKQVKQFQKEEEKILTEDIGQVFFSDDYFKRTNDIEKLNSKYKSWVEACRTKAIQSEELYKTCMNENFSENNSLITQITEVSSIKDTLDKRLFKDEINDLQDAYDYMKDLKIEKFDDADKAVASQYDVARTKLAISKQKLIDSVKIINQHPQKKSELREKYNKSIKSTFINGKEDQSLIIDAFKDIFNDTDGTLGSQKLISKDEKNELSFDQDILDQFLGKLNSSDEAIDKIDKQKKDLSILSSQVAKKISELRGSSPMKELYTIKSFYIQETINACKEVEGQSVERIHASCIANKEIVDQDIVKFSEDIIVQIQNNEAYAQRGNANAACNEIYKYYDSKKKLEEYYKNVSDICTDAHIDFHQIRNANKFNESEVKAAINETKNAQTNNSYKSKMFGEKTTVKYFDSKGKVKGKYSRNPGYHKWISASVKSGMGLVPDYLNYRFMDYGLEQKVAYGMYEKDVQAYNDAVYNSPQYMDYIFGNPATYTPMPMYGTSNYTGQAGFGF